MSQCIVDKCEKPARNGRGWCGMHYMRWRRHGDPNGGEAHYRDPELCFAARTEWRGNCLIWTGSLDGNGYGQLRVDGKAAPAHRYAWERQHGPVPDGMVMDHTCWTPTCVNVEHLRPATRTQNNANQSGAYANSATGIRGVHRKGSSWRAEATKGGQHYSGTYRTIEEAEAAVVALRAELFGEYAGR